MQMSVVNEDITSNQYKIYVTKIFRKRYLQYIATRLPYVKEDPYNLATVKVTEGTEVQIIGYGQQKKQVGYI